MPVPVLRKLQTKTSASLLYGNLSCNGKCLAYVHHAEVLVVSDSSVLSGNPTPVVVRLPIKDEAVVKQARFIELGGTDYLVVAGQRALQIYTGDGKKCIHLQPVLSPGTAKAPRSARAASPPPSLLHVLTVRRPLPSGTPIHCGTPSPCYTPFPASSEASRESRRAAATSYAPAPRRVISRCSRATPAPLATPSSSRSRARPSATSTRRRTPRTLTSACWRVLLNHLLIHYLCTLLATYALLIHYLHYLLLATDYLPSPYQASAASDGQLLLLMVGPGGSCGAYASFGGDPNALCTALQPQT